MRQNRRLKKLRKEYIHTKIPPRLEVYGWLNLKNALEEEKKPSFVPFWFSRVILASMLMLFLSGSFFTLVSSLKTALPGENLYPFKRFSEDIFLPLLDNKIGNRADEVIGLIKKEKEDQVKIKEALEEYKNIVTDTKTEVKQSNKGKKGVEEKLENQLKRFEQTLPSVSTPSGKILDEAIKVTRQAKEEIEQLEKQEEEKGKEELENEDNKGSEETSRPGSNSGKD